MSNTNMQIRIEHCEGIIKKPIHEKGTVVIGREPGSLRWQCSKDTRKERGVIRYTVL